MNVLKSESFACSALFIIPTIALLIVISIFPMTIDSDNGLMISALEQYHLNKVGRLHTFKGVSAEDLSNDVNVWISWYTPGVTFLFYPANFLPFSSLGLCIKQLSWSFDHDP